MTGSMCCGVDATTTDRIIGGSPASLKQFPWLAWIEMENVTTNKFDLICGGSLISGLYVLTAAHCVVLGNDTRLTNVYLGDYNKSHTGPDCIQENGAEICSDGEVKIAIERMIPHAYYNSQTLNNDIALIKLAKMAPYTEFVRPICLPMLDFNMAARNHVRLTGAGWGTTGVVKSEADEYYLIYPDIKQHVKLPFVPLERCRVQFPSVTSYQICAGGKKGEDTCFGDSGGPLMYNNDGVYELVGVAGFAPATFGISTADALTNWATAVLIEPAKVLMPKVAVQILSAVKILQV
ncbi:trypsin domain-containing protein [Phthorimaea operculella]|nr:trypsin domain-containing protein [Phthorimaea operculella]